MSAARDTLVAEAAKIVAAGIEIGPRLDPCVCSAPRHLHGGKSMSGSCETTDCRRYRADQAHVMAFRALDAAAVSLGDALAESERRQRDAYYRRNPRGEGEWSIGASDTQTCPRKIQYRNRPPEGFVPLPENKRAARMGTIIHEEATRWLKALYPWRMFKMRLPIAGLDRESELDMYDPITATITDVKTAGDWKWDKIGDDGPDWDTWEQALLYGLALEDAGYPVRRVRLEYIKRCNGQDEGFEIAYDRSLAEAARDRLVGYAEALDLGVDLPKAGNGPTTDAICRMCSARAHCWNMDQAKVLGRSPENLTILGPDPDDESISWAIETKVTASATRLAAEKAENEAKALVDGIEPGRYGPNCEWEVYNQHRKGLPNYKASYEQVVDYLDLPDGQRPGPDAVTPVLGKASTITKHGKVRKATLDAEKKARAALEAEA